MSSELDPPSDLGGYLAGLDEEQAGEIRDSPRDIGSRMAEARVAADLTAEQLGAQLGVLDDTVAAWEAGELAARSNMLARAAGVLGVSLSWLVMGHGVAPPEDDAPQLQEMKQTLLDVRAQLTTLSRDLERVISGLEQMPTASESAPERT